MMVHFAIADTSGRSVAVEYVNNEMSVVETPIVTNFYLTPGEKYGIGTEESHRRYEILTETLADHPSMTAEEVRDAMDSAVLPLPQEQANLTYISGLLDSRGAVSTQIGQADKSFQRLVQGSWSYLLDNWLCGEDRSEGDLEGWRQVREQSESDSAMISGCRRLLQPFQSLLELTRPRTMFDSTVSAAADTANSHFGMELTPPVVRSSFCKVMQDTPGVLSFLEEVSVIESLLNHAEALSTDRHETRSVSAQTAGGFQTSCPQLLRELGEGQDRTGAILAAFPRPDPLEQAVMLGQTEEARALLEDPAARKELELDEPEEILDRLERIVPLSGEFSLYGAGMRLALTLGSRRGQAERCFLVGLSMGDLRCVECLFNLYRPAGRNEELDALYTAFGSQISEELRGKFVSSLLLSGSIDPLQSLREDVLSFLAPELLERFTAPEAAMELVREQFRREVDRRAALGEETGAMFAGAFRFLEEALGQSQELVIFVTEITAGYDTSWFVENFGCEAYFRHNQELLFDGTRRRIRDEIAAVRAAELEEMQHE